MKDFKYWDDMWNINPNIRKIKINDIVRHNKEGVGIVKSICENEDKVSVLFDGHTKFKIVRKNELYVYKKNVP